MAIRTRLRITTYDGQILDVEDFLKKEIYERKIEIQTAAQLCGIEELSFRNKLSRHALSVKDVAVLSELVGYQLAIIDPNSVETPTKFKFSAKYFTDKDNYLAELKKNCTESEIRVTENVPDRSNIGNSSIIGIEPEKKNYIKKESAPTLKTVINGVVVYQSITGKIYAVSGDNVGIAMDTINDLKVLCLSEMDEAVVFIAVSKKFGVTIEPVSDEISQLIKKWDIKI